MTQPEDQEGMLESVRTIAKIVDEEARRNDIGYERVVVAGFSQGDLHACRYEFRDDTDMPSLPPRRFDLSIIWAHIET